MRKTHRHAGGYRSLDCLILTILVGPSLGAKSQNLSAQRGNLFVWGVFDRARAFRSGQRAFRSGAAAGCHRCPGAPSGGGGPPRPPPVPLPPAARRQRRRPPLHQRWRDGCRRGAGRCRAQRVPPDRPTRARRILRRPRRAEHPRVASPRIGEQRKLLASPLGSAAAPAAFSDLKPTLSADRSI